MGKRVRNIGIIFFLTLIVYKYAETTVIYQAEIIADQEDTGQNVIEREQMNQQMMQMASADDPAALTESQAEQIIKESNLYDNELKKCEWVWENREKVNDIKKNYPYFDPTYDELCLYGGDDLLMYCIQDLNGDDTPELIVGVRTVETILTVENGVDHWTESPTTRILIIYRYEEGKLRAEFVERDSLEIYKNGMIEYTRRMYGKYPGLEHHYYCYTPNSGKVKELEALGESDEELEGKKPTRFFRVIDDEYQVEITEEEYTRQKEFYIGEGKEELQWKELTGFLEGGETFESLFSKEDICDSG